jgi:hypothetical protein
VNAIAFKDASRGVTLRDNIFMNGHKRKLVKDPSSVVVS